MRRKLAAALVVVLAACSSASSSEESCLEAIDRAKDEYAAAAALTEDPTSPGGTETTVAEAEALRPLFQAIIETETCLG